MYIDVKSDADLLPPGAQPGTVPTDLEQATGLERLEILGKMQGVDVFDMKPLDSSRVGKSMFLENGKAGSTRQSTAIVPDWIPKETGEERC